MLTYYLILGSSGRSKSTDSKAVKEVAAANGSAKEAGTEKTKAGAEKKEKKEKKTKKEKKDDNGLKRPLSAYMLFNNSRRPLIKQDFPGKYFIQILASFPEFPGLFPF